jgi:hypothetical protein
MAQSTNKLFTWEEFEANNKKQSDWEAKHPLLTFFINLWYLPGRLYYSHIRYLHKEIYWFFQRGFTGVADCDRWNWYAYNARNNRAVLQWLRKNKLGVPGDCFPKYRARRNPTKAEEKQAEKNWNTILDKMIYSFDCLVKESEGDLYFWLASKKDKNKHWCADLKKQKPDLYKDVYLMTKEDDKRFKEGLQLYIKHYMSLLD